MKQGTFSDLTGFLGQIQAKKNTQQRGSIAGTFDSRRNMLDLNLLVGIDVSGSITSAMFKDFMVQLNAIKGMSRIKVIEVGDKIEAIYDFSRPAAKIARLGGGGGNGEHLFFPLAKKMAPDAILYMTDGYCTQAADPNIPVGWILTANGTKPYGWGKIVGQLPH